MNRGPPTDYLAHRLTDVSQGVILNGKDLQKSSLNFSTNKSKVLKLDNTIIIEIELIVNRVRFQFEYHSLTFTGKGCFPTNPTCFG